MGKVKGWLMDMQEDAMWMSRDSWAARHGAHNLDVYDEAVEHWSDHVESAGKEAYGNVEMEEDNADS